MTSETLVPSLADALPFSRAAKAANRSYHVLLVDAAMGRLEVLTIAGKLFVLRDELKQYIERQPAP